MHNYVRVMLSAITGFLICNHSVADATLSLESTNDYVFVKNIRYPIEGRGMGTSGGYNIIRGEDVAFLSEGFAEAQLFLRYTSAGSGSVYNPVWTDAGGFLADIDSLSDFAMWFPSPFIVNDVDTLIHTSRFGEGMFDGGIPSPPMTILSSTNEYFRYQEALSLMYTNSVYGDIWKVDEDFQKMYKHMITASSYQYKYIMKKSNIQNTYSILQRLQDLYMHRYDAQNFTVFNSSTGYSNGSIRRLKTESGEKYRKSSIYEYTYDRDDHNYIIGISWTNNNEKIDYDPDVYGDRLLDYEYSELKYHSELVWAKHTSDRVDEDEYGNVTTTKLYTAEMSYGGLNNVEELNDGIALMGLNNLLVEFSYDYIFATNRTPFTELVYPLSDVEAVVSFTAYADYYYSEMVSNNNSVVTNVISKSLSKSYLAVERIPNPKFKLAKPSSSYNYNYIYIIIPDSVYLSAIERLKKYAKDDLYKSPDAPPRPSISLKSSNVESGEVNSSYEWSQPSLRMRNSIYINISRPDVILYSFKPKYRVTFEE